MYIQASWTLDLDSPDLKLLKRHVKYWKRRKYVYFIDEYKNIIDNMAMELCKQIDKEILEEILALTKGKEHDSSTKILG